MPRTHNGFFSIQPLPIPQMKTRILLAFASVMLLSAASADPQLRSDGYVTFASVANPTDLNSLTSIQHGWSYYGSSGTVYFHHRFHGNGEDFRIRKLSMSIDSDGDGVYTAFVDQSPLPTPGSGSPSYILKKDGAVLPNATMKNAVCDEVIILNNSFLGRSFSGGVKWKLETDFPDVIEWTTHAPINPFSSSLSIQNYIGKPHVIANGNAGDVVEYSYDLASWSDHFTLENGGITILSPPAVEAGQPRKFFRIKE